MKLRDKIRYKIWKHLNKKLQKDKIIPKSKTALFDFRTDSVPFIQPQNTYKQIVIGQGFGHSGSGVLVDFFSEFNNFTVLGSHDTWCGGKKAQLCDKSYVDELDFYRRVDGVKFLGNILTQKGDSLIKHAALSRFLYMSEYFYSQGGFYSDEYMRQTIHFIKNLLDYTIPKYHSEGQYWFEEIVPLRDEKTLELKPSGCLISKVLSMDEYVKYAAEYMKAIFEMVESKEFLFLDQLCGDGRADFQENVKYLGNAKQICVWRDPRDVYCTGVTRGEIWIPTEVENFVKWYTAVLPDYLNTPHPLRLTVRFEDIVLDYENTTKKIMKFVGLKECQHIDKKQYFNPEISSKNIGIWKTFENKEAIKQIEKMLPQYLYKGEQHG